MNQWDKYFLEICEKVAENSKCLSRKVGAILVRENRILCSGYNGPPSGVPHCSERYDLDEKLKFEISIAHDVAILEDREFPEPEKMRKLCPRRTLGLESGEGLDWCIAGHGERNVLTTAAKFGISTNGAMLYCNCAVPCSPCLIEIINSGISEVVVTEIRYYDVMSEWLVKNSKLKVRVYDI